MISLPSIRLLLLASRLVSICPLLLRSMQSASATAILTKVPPDRFPAQTFPSRSTAVRLGLPLPGGIR